MHDYFDILGVSRNARASEIRRACGRRLRAAHPDISDGDFGAGRPSGAAAADEPGRFPEALCDAAVDFVEMTPLVERMRARFFAAHASSH